MSRFLTLPKWGEIRRPTYYGDARIFHHKWAWFHQHLVFAYHAMEEVTSETDDFTPIRDWSRNKRHGTLDNTNSDIRLREGKFGRSYDFFGTGTTDGIRFGTFTSSDPAKLSGLNAFTFFSAGVHTDRGSAHQTIFNMSSSDTGFADDGYMYRYTSSVDRFEFLVKNSGTTRRRDGANVSLPDGSEYTHGYVVRDLDGIGEAFSWLNGVESPAFTVTLSAATVSSTSCDLKVGNSSDRNFLDQIHVFYILDAAAPDWIMRELNKDPFAPFRQYRVPSFPSLSGGVETGVGS
jgi:hypothetical protein